MPCPVILFAQDHLCYCGYSVVLNEFWHLFFYFCEECRLIGITPHLYIVLNSIDILTPNLRLLDFFHQYFVIFIVEAIYFLG